MRFAAVGAMRQQHALFFCGFPEKCEIGVGCQGLRMKGDMFVTHLEPLKNDSGVGITCADETARARR